MTCFSALSQLAESDLAIRELTTRLEERLRGEAADLVVLFASPHHAETLSKHAVDLRSRGMARRVLGCSGESIIGDDQEVEGSPALSLWAIQSPGLKVAPLRLKYEDEKCLGCEDLPAVADVASGTTLLFLGDPFTFPSDSFLKQVNEGSPGLRVVGGMASASRMPGGNRLVLDDQVFDDGGVAVALSGDVTIRTIVSQGCRPIGRTFVVTRVDRNIIRELGRRPALEVLREVFDDLDSTDQDRVREGLHIGRVISEYQETFQRGDFLVRNVLGADEQGGIAISDLVRVGQTVQFHVRDEETADEDLRTLLEDERLARPSTTITGGLIFSCNGRGTRMFSTRNHDVGVVHQKLGPIPVAGFFAMGELGPVGGTNFIHGYTASVVLFEKNEPR